MFTSEIEYQTRELRWGMVRLQGWVRGAPLRRSCFSQPRLLHVCAVAGAVGGKDGGVDVRDGEGRLTYLWAKGIFQHSKSRLSHYS